MSIIEFRDVDKNFGDFRALSGINLDVQQGEVVVICGPSGCGKSTLLRCINYLEAIDQGTVSVKGIEVLEETAQRVRKHVAMVFQHFELFPHLTVLENCTLGPIKSGRMNKLDAEKLAAKWLEQVGILSKKEMYPASLSGGEKQRAAIVRALCLEPDVLLFDEPTSALDPEMISEVLEVMASLAAEGRTMVIVTHEMGFARKVANRIIYVDKGKIIEEGDAESFFTQPKHEATRHFLSKIIH